MLGTRKPAEEGKLVVLVSGEGRLIEQARPVLDAIGSRTVVVGDRLGAASALKLACNAWVATITAATAQSVALAEALGVDPAQVPRVDRRWSDRFAVRAAQGQGDDRRATGRTSFAVDGVIKDVDLMRAAGADAGIPTQLLDAVREMFARASDAGHGSDDMAAVRAAF